MSAGGPMRLTTVALLFTAALPAAEIPRGAHALLKMVNSISTRTAREGDYVYMRTATPIVSNNQIVVPADSYVQGVVSHSKRSGRVTGRAELAIRIETLTLPSGKVIKVTPHLSSVDSEGSEQKVDKEGGIQQGASKGADAETTCAPSGAGGPV